MSIPDSTIEEIRQRASIAEIAAEFVELRRSGRSLVALCPFHKEKSPSFHLNEEEGYFNCFGCGKKGDIFKLLMELRNWTFPEAVQFLANRYGVRIPQIRDTSPERETGALLRKTATAATRVFTNNLFDEQLGKRARDYLAQRGVSVDTIRQFQLGYALGQSESFIPAVHSLLPELSLETLVDYLTQLGLLRRGGDEQNGRVFNFFRDRIVFPICRSDGCPIAFGGRVITPVENAPKYLNTPESAIYKKRRTLYGIAQASPALRQARRVFLVEGYTDVMALHQAGIANVLATCGTAVTEEHAQVLARMADVAVIVFDGDAAGRSAAARCFERFINSGVELKVSFLPEGDDPDSLVRKGGAAHFTQFVEEYSQSGLTAFLEHELGEGSDSSVSVVHTAKVAERAVRLLAKVRNSVEQELLLREAAAFLKVPLESLTQLRSKTTSTRLSVSDSRPQPIPSAPSIVASWQRASVSPEFVATQPRVASKSGRRSAVVTYFNQLLIALICHPELARAMPEIDSLLKVLSPEAAEKIQKLVQAISAGDAPAGLAAVVATEVEAEGVEQWQAFLLQLGLSGKVDFVAEALRQLRIGGGRPDELVSDAFWVQARVSVKQQLQVLRAEEAQAGDLQQKVALAQEKLRAKREHDRLRVRGEK